MAFVRVAALDDLWRGEMRGYVVHGSKILLVRTEADVHAYEDRCAHLGVMLSEGTLEGHVLRCRAHHWEYDACTGHGINPPTTQLKAFPVEVKQGDVYVDLERR